MRMADRLHVDEDVIDLHRILCPVDFSEPSLRALRHASAFASWYEAALTALYVNPTLPIEPHGDLGRSTAVMQELRGFVK
jgi:nucleotide-binding universal stress UspA family protein